jgi:hypothetical protein
MATTVAAQHLTFSMHEKTQQTIPHKGRRDRQSEPNAAMETF